MTMALLMIRHKERRKVQSFPKKVEIQYTFEKLKRLFGGKYKKYKRKRGSNLLKHKVKNERFCDLLEGVSVYCY